MPVVLLFTGGCRSGKSALAQRWVESLGTHRAYVASARADLGQGDAELAARVAAHQAARGAGWLTFEPEMFSCPYPLSPAGTDEPGGRVASGFPSPALIHDLPAALRAASRQADSLLFDCVTLWLSGLLAAGLDDAAVLAELDRLLAILPELPVPLALVTNETGGGLAPASPLARRFRDLAGLVNQRLAHAAHGVILAVCGLPLAVKGTLPPVLSA